MARSGWRAVAAGATVVVGAAAGVVTNIVTSRVTVGLVVALGCLVIAGVTLQVLVTVLEGGGASGAAPVRLRARASGRAQVIQAGRDVRLPGPLPEASPPEDRRRPASSREAG